jgi:hypothetical protein
VASCSKTFLDAWALRLRREWSEPGPLRLPPEPE